MRGVVGLLAVLVIGIGVAGCGQTEEQPAARSIDVADYADGLHGAWQAIMVANHNGLDLQGVWLEEPGPGEEIELVFPAEWSTDDDTHVEWLDLHILETHGIDVGYADIAAAWKLHLNNDIWVSTRRARDLMDDGVLPPHTGSAELNPEGVWSMDAQLETELFGLIAPGLPEVARDRARYFARITNSGLAVDVSAFYADLYAEAFVESNLDWLLDRALANETDDSEIADIVNTVRGWHAEHADWRETRANIGHAYDTDPAWWASRVNFAVTIMALLYGDGDMISTINIAALAGWDADNNMTTAAGLLGIISGFDGLPAPFRSASDVYFNEDLTGPLPKFDSVRNIAVRTQRLGEAVLFQHGARLDGDVYRVPFTVGVSEGLG